mgnify:FL=1
MSCIKNMMLYLKNSRINNYDEISYILLKTELSTCSEVVNL